MREDITSLLLEISRLRNGSLGKITAAKHHIDLKANSRRAFQYPCRAGLKTREPANQKTDRILRAVAIRPAMSERANLVELAPKKDGTLRFCFDYRKPNDMTMRNESSLSWMEGCIESLGNAARLFTFDCISWYWQIEIFEADCNKTILSGHHSSFPFIRVPFELKNVRASFQRPVEVIDSGVMWKFALAYLDDIILNSKSVAEHS